MVWCICAVYCSSGADNFADTADVIVVPVGDQDLAVAGISVSRYLYPAVRKGEEWIYQQL